MKSDFRLAKIMVVTLLSLFLIAEAMATGHRYDSNDVFPLPIPDPGTTSSCIFVRDPFIVEDVNVELDITHGWNTDLHVYLIHDGVRVELFTDVGGTADDFCNTKLDDECPTPITRGEPPFNGCYSPEGNLSDFDGINAYGYWCLEVSDVDPMMSGTLNSWSLIIEYAPVAKCQDVTVPADKNCQADVTAEDVDCGSFDFSGDPITLTLDPPGPYPIGVHDVNLIVTDDKASDSNSAKVTVLPTAYCYKKEAIDDKLQKIVRDPNNPNDPNAALLNQAIELLKMSLGKNWEVVWAGPDRVAQWQGGYWYHVDPNMFDYELEACNLVTTYEQNTGTDMKPILRLLAEADNKLADTAISDAIFQSDDPNDPNIAEAKRLRNEANAAKARGEYCLALRKYIQAWKKAIDSLGPDVDINRDGKVYDDDFDIFVDQWLEAINFSDP